MAQIYLKRFLGWYRTMRTSTMGPVGDAASRMSLINWVIGWLFFNRMAMAHMYSKLIDFMTCNIIHVIQSETIRFEVVPSTSDYPATLSLSISTSVNL
jgi:hypothetical protein